MINKDKAIKKAVAKYHSIFPVRGKQSIEECFFCWRGEYYFLFKTKDKKSHVMKAELSRPVTASVDINRDLFLPLYKVLNKPILVRPLFMINTESSKPVADYVDTNRDFFFPIYQALNKPILVRSLFIKNAETARPVADYVDTNRDFFFPIYKALNKPILVRSLFIKNAQNGIHYPVGAHGVHSP